jgi:quercetin dioxygenase-like cupin family protein
MNMSLYLASVLMLTVSAGVPSDAQAPASGQALALAVDSPSVKWGPCPEFMPKGCEIAVLHGDPAGANADVFLRVPAGADIPRHRHTSAERMVLISGELRVAYDGQAPVTLKPGMYAYGPAMLPHSASCESTGPCVLFIAFESAVDAVPVKKN